MTVGSLFAGIGGLDLGAERAGFDVIWQCEKDDYCTKVLNKHWPNTPVYSDVQTLYRSPLRNSAYPAKPDVLCGGFPCQDISLAGDGGGLNGDRSGLWWQFARIIRLVRPRYVVVENVPTLTYRGLDAILGWLATHGYDAEWQIVSAAAMGAPHIRERLFVVAYPSGLGRSRPGGARRRLHDGDRNCESTVRGQSQQQSRASGDGEAARDVADAPSTGRDATRRPSKTVFGPRTQQRLARCRRSRGARKWSTEPKVGRLADGVPDRVDRTRALGNAVVPQVAEFVFNCVKEHRRSSR